MHIDALSLLTIRVLFALPFFLAAAILISSSAGNQRMTRLEWAHVFLLGLSGYYVSSLFDFMGLQYISAGLERLILFLYPSFTVFINAMFFRQPIRRVHVWSLVLTYAGIAIAYLGELHLDSANPGFVKGCLLVFACAITYAIYISGSGKLVQKVGSNKFTAYAMLSATAGIFVHFLLRGQSGLAGTIVRVWPHALLLATIATVLPTFLTAAALKRVGSGNVAVISGIGPVSTIVQAHYFLGEPVLVQQLIGTVLVVAGVLLTGFQKRPKTAEEIG